MKNILTMVIAALMMSVSFSAVASDKITVINPASQASPNAVVTRAYSDAAGGTVYQSANCEDAENKYKKTKNAVMIYDSSIEFAARNKSLACGLNLAPKKNVIWTGQTYFKICRLPGTAGSLEKSNTQYTMGTASMIATKGHQKTLNDKGVNTKIVAFSGSKTVLRALLAGDIDLGFMGSGIADSAGDKIECLYYTDPAASNFLAKTADIEIPNFKIAYAIYTNSTDPKVIARLKAVANDKGWNRFLVKSNTTGTFDKASEPEVQSFVDRLSKFW